MKAVDEIYPFGINTSIGPTGTIKRLFKNRDYFLQRGYSMSIFALQVQRRTLWGTNQVLSEITQLPDGGQVQFSSKKGNNWKSLLKSRKHAFVESNYFTSAWAYHHTCNSFASHIKQYLSLNRNPDVVVFHDVHSCYYYCKLRRSSNAKVVMFVHGDGTDADMFVKRKPTLNNTREHRQHKAQIQYTYENSDCIVWISKLAKDRFCHNHPEFAPKAVAVVNGIDDMPMLEKSISSDFKYRLVSTGTVCERKGQYIIIEGMKRMRPEILKDTHLTVIGSGPDHAKLVSLCEQYGLKENVSFLGNVPNKDVPGRLAAENIYVLMSNNEGLPISILEAMRAGLPVISTRVAGIPEEVDDRNGILIEPDIAQMTEVLNSLPLYDWNALGEASRLRFEQEFTFEIMRSNYASMFDGLCK